MTIYVDDSLEDCLCNDPYNVIVFKDSLFNSNSNISFGLDNNNQLYYCLNNSNQNCLSPNFQVGNLSLLVNLTNPVSSSVSLSILLNNSIIQTGSINSNNNFVFSNLIPAEYTLLYSTSGFTDNQSINLTEDSNLTLSIPTQNSTLVIQVVNQSLMNIPISFLANLQYGNQSFSCNSIICSFIIPQNIPYNLTVSSNGFASVSLTNSQVSVPIVFQKIVLFPNSNSFNYLGLFDSNSNLIQSINPNNTYYLHFSLSIPSNSIDSLYLQNPNSTSDLNILQVNPADNANFYSISYSKDFSESAYCSNSKLADLNWIDVQILNNQSTTLNDILSIPISSYNLVNSINYLSYVNAITSSSSSLSEIESNLHSLICTNSENNLIQIISSNQSSTCIYQETTYQNGCIRNSNSLMCNNGSIISNPSICGCPSGQTYSNGMCENQYCQDGTLAYTCSKVTFPYYCSVLSNGQTSLILNSSISCSCPSGKFNSGGVCLPCTGNSCKTSCNLNGQNVSVGCINFQNPLYCSTNGTISYSPQICGCPASEYYDPSSSICRPSVNSLCSNISNSQSFCSSQIPYQCVSTPSGYQTVINNAVCGCPSSEQLINGSCQLISQNSTNNSSTQNNSTINYTNLQCQNANTCFSKSTNDLFCNSGNQVVSYCQYCNPSCDSNNNLFCNPSSNSCEPKTCSDGTSLNSCSSNYPGYRCQLSGNTATLEKSFVFCSPCPNNEIWNSTINACSICIGSSCQLNSNNSCYFQLNSNSYAYGTCLPNYYSSQGEALRCENNGQIQPDASCGCQTGYSLNANGDSCFSDNQTVYTSNASSISCPTCT